MPFLRFGHDKRGYETTALLHAFRQHGRAHPRILYWFRSPGGVKVGRNALDEDAIRLIEEHHRDLLFDWPKILQVQAQDPPQTVPVRYSSAGVPPSRRADPVEHEQAASAVREEPSQAPVARKRRRRQREADVPTGDASPVDRPAPTDASASTTGNDAEDVSLVPPQLTAAHDRFSSADLERLRGRYAVLLRRIDEQLEDPVAAELLRGRAEELNPDTWVTTQDVDGALERYEQVYREIRDALGPRRRRS